ncbi:peroxide stress protein YaaA [Lacticaseibacillus zhaodongensis]|uniref:peroxide stress protein YaaA n=1 Tax=Lacticaseibacillus zhaodongensis TaxID=2668065 RepID=UPI0012D36F2F|nr:peroxide stress protein YaaA [Lacticaseibacillus zhaodongensis]
MQFIIAPAKKMRVDTDNFAIQSWPQYLPEAERLLARLQTLSYDQAKQLWRCSDKLARPNYEWLQQLDLRKNVTPAVMSFIGLQYQSMAPDLLPKAGLQYLAANLRILSGFYGVLRAFDAVVPYRLELGSRLQVGRAKNLYAFWGDRLYRALDWTQPVVNLASEEYAKAVRPYLQPGDQFVTVVFAHLAAGQLQTRATYAKMARGAMVRYAAEQQVTSLDKLKNFADPHYHFAEAYSTATKLVFLRASSAN